jgi:tRNA threonylcarbamoyladenosine biosynthesis protein TsaB
VDTKSVQTFFSLSGGSATFLFLHRMNILAIDQSLPLGSAAVLQQGTVAAEASWTGTQLRNQHLFVTIPPLLKQAEIEWLQIDCFAVSLGPGSFSGLRISLAAAEGFAAPGKKPLRGISTGALIAWNCFDRHGVDRATVVGDARRGRFWTASFCKGPAGPVTLRDYTLVTPDALTGSVPKDELVVTPDWERIGASLRQALRSTATPVEKASPPLAGTLGRLVWMARQTDDSEGGDPEPERPELIYLHPPVFVTPKTETP